MFDFDCLPQCIAMERANAANQECRQSVRLWGMECATQANSVNVRRQMMKRATFLTIQRSYLKESGKAREKSQSALKVS